MIVMIYIYMCVITVSRRRPSLQEMKALCGQRGRLQGHHRSLPSCTTGEKVHEVDEQQPARAHLGRRSHSAIGHFFSYLQPRLVFGDVGKVSGVVAQQVVHVPQVNMNVNISTPPQPSDVTSVVRVPQVNMNVNIPTPHHTTPPHPTPPHADPDETLRLIGWNTPKKIYIPLEKTTSKTRANSRAEGSIWMIG